MWSAALADTILVTLPCTETDAERKARIARGEALPHFSYMATKLDDTEDDGDESTN